MHKFITMPFQSQALKARAQKRAIPSSSELKVEAQLTSTRIPGDTTQQTQALQSFKKVKKSHTSTTPPNTFELSCTIFVGTKDIDVGLFKNVQSFIKKVYFRIVFN